MTRGMIAKASLLGVLLLLPLSGAVSAQSRVQFDGIPLGRPVKAISVDLKSKGYKRAGKPFKEDSMFYGKCRKVFFLGRFHGEPAVVALTESLKTGMVYCLDVQLREFIDSDEAIERLNVIIAEDAGRYPHFTRKKSSLTSMVEMVDVRGHLTKYVVSPEAECLLCFFEDALEENYIGCASYQVDDLMSRSEHIIDIHYYDARSGMEAMKK